jgi:hypothetical protein
VKLRLPGELPPEDEPERARPRRKKRRRRPKLEETTEVGETPEWVAAAIILALGLILSVGGMAVAEGRDGFAIGLAAVGVRLLVTVPLSIAGLLITAPLLGITFGTIGMAILKLAAINVLSLSIALTAIFAGAPALVGYALAAPIDWFLFKWLFELEFSETMIVLTVIGLIQFLANLAVTAAQLRAGW